MKIIAAADHGGFELKDQLVAHLREEPFGLLHPQALVEVDDRTVAGGHECRHEPPITRGVVDENSIRTWSVPHAVSVDPPQPVA